MFEPIDTRFINLLFGRRRMLSVALTWQRMMSREFFVATIDAAVSYLFSWKASQVGGRPLCLDRQQHGPVVSLSYVCLLFLGCSKGQGTPPTRRSVNPFHVLIFWARFSAGDFSSDGECLLHSVVRSFPLGWVSRFLLPMQHDHLRGQYSSREGKARNLSPHKRMKNLMFLLGR